MAKPTNRAEFKEYCLRAIGKDVITINVSDDQIEDRIDEAISFYQDYHYSGNKDNLILYEITPLDVAQKSIPMPAGTLGVTHVYSTMMNRYGFHQWQSAQYQLRFDDVFSLTRSNMVSYYTTLITIETFNNILTPPYRFRYNQHDQRLHIDASWSERGLEQGVFLLIDVTGRTDPNIDTTMWGDRILQKLCIAYLKRQWGENLKKFVGVSLAGGVQLNADKIYDMAMEDIEKLESDFILKYQMPDDFYVG